MKVASAVAFQIAIANDNSHGYDQNDRWGNPDYDCSGLNITAWQQAGVPVKTNGATYTGNMGSVYLKTGFIDVTAMVDRNSGARMVQGDVLLNHANHVATYLTGNKVVQASSNEFGGITGGKSGDQTGREIWVTNYYNFPWNMILRFNEEISYEWIYDENAYLTQEQMENNAICFYYKMSSMGWSFNSICGMLGNIQSESRINPAIWESFQTGNMSVGYGLVQWTPASKYIAWAGTDYGKGDKQCERIEWECNNNAQWIATNSYPISFQEFKNSQQDVGYLANAFLLNYERPYNSNQPIRAEQARYWYEFLSNIEPPKPVKTKNKSLPILRHQFF